MKRIDPKLLELAVVPPGTPMFVDLVARLENDEDLSSTRRRDLLSGLRRVARALGRSPEQIPADPRWLRPRLDRVAPAAVGLTPKSWTNALSDCRAALSRCGVTDSRRNNRIEDLSPAWARLWRLALDSKDWSITAAVRGFVFFLDRMGVAPGEVTDAHADAWLQVLDANRIGSDPARSHRAAVNSWNLAIERLPDWPRARLVLPDRRRIVRLPLDTYPPSFAEDLERWQTSLSNPDPFDADAPPQPLRKQTLRQYRYVVERFASVLVQAGVPAEEIDGLAALVSPARLKIGLRHMLDANDGAKCVGISQTASVLSNLARRHVRLDAGDVAEIHRIARRVSVPPPRGMTAKNRARLRTLSTPDLRGRLLRLPETLFAKAGSEKAPLRALIMREDAVAIAILLCCPIRSGNLVAIDVERHLERPGRGRTFLKFPESEVKNGRTIEFELPVRVADMIDRHVTTRSPAICPAGTPFLFPRRDGSAPMVRSELGAKITKRIRKELGADMNPHLFRHFAAMIWLEANPGQYEVVRRLLGHAALSRTLDLYAGFEAGSATRLFAELLSEQARR